MGGFPDRRAFLAELEAEAAEKHSNSASARAIDAALQASLSTEVSTATGPSAAHWPVVDETHKYAVVRKNNWSQTDEDKDLSTLRGIHSTIDFITRGLNSFDKGLEHVKTEIRTGKRESLEAELRSAHDKYRKQAQWEIDKLAAQLDAQRKAQNSMIASAVVSAQMKLQRSWDAKLAEMEAPLRAKIEELEGEVRQRSHRLVESENEADMLRQDKLHLEQKLANMVTEMESGTYSPIVNQLMEELNTEKDRNEALQQMRDDLELDLKELRAAARKEAEELMTIRQRLNAATMENFTLRRNAAEKVRAAEEAARAEVRAQQEVAGRLREELHAARGDFHRQVQIQDVMNVRYTEEVEALRARVRELEGVAENERRRVTSFLQSNSVPAVMRELSRAVNSKRLAERNGMSELRKHVVTLVMQLDKVIAGLPSAIRLMEGARLPPSAAAAFTTTLDNDRNDDLSTPRPLPISMAVGGGPHQHFPRRQQQQQQEDCADGSSISMPPGAHQDFWSSAPQLPSDFQLWSAANNNRASPRPTPPPPPQPTTSDAPPPPHVHGATASFPSGVGPAVVTTDEGDDPLSAELSFSPRTSSQQRPSTVEQEQSTAQSTTRLLPAIPNITSPTHEAPEAAPHPPPPRHSSSSPSSPRCAVGRGGGGYLSPHYRPKHDDDDPPPDSVVAQLREMGHVKQFIKSYQDDLRAALAADACSSSSSGVHAQQLQSTQAHQSGRARASASPRARVPKLVLPNNPASKQSSSRVADYHIHSAASARDHGGPQEEAVDMFSE